MHQTKSETTIIINFANVHKKKQLDIVNLLLLFTSHLKSRVLSDDISVN